MQKAKSPDSRADFRIEPTIASKNWMMDGNGIGKKGGSSSARFPLEFIMNGWQGLSLSWSRD